MKVALARRVVRGEPDVDLYGLFFDGGFRGLLGSVVLDGLLGDFYVRDHRLLEPLVIDRPDVLLAFVDGDCMATGANESSRQEGGVCRQELGVGFLDLVKRDF